MQNSTTRLSTSAPIFTPGQPWLGRDNAELEKAPLIVYGDIDYEGKSISDTSKYMSTAYSSGETLLHESTPTEEAQVDSLPTSSCRRARRASTYAQVDNTARATEARQVFDHHFGCDDNNLQAWQDLCFFCGINPDKMPTNIGNCRKELRRTYVNVFDVVEAVDRCQVAEPRFDNARELEIYSRQVGKICPVAAAEGSPLFRFMLKKWF